MWKPRGVDIYQHQRADDGGCGMATGSVYELVQQHRSGYGCCSPRECVYPGCAVCKDDDRYSSGVECAGRDYGSCGDAQYVSRYFIDILSTCVNSAGGVAGDGSACGTLFAATTLAGGTAPVDVSGAGLNIANNPTANVSTLFGLVQATAPFQPMLPMAPSDWTVQLAATTAGLIVSPSALTFPAANLGFFPTQTLTITNTGAGPIGLTGFSFAGVNAGDFSMSNPCPTYLLSGGVCSIQIIFSPYGVGPRTASLSVLSSAVNSPQTISLSGSGLAPSGMPLTFSPSPLTFTLLGVPQNVTVTNNGSTSVGIGSIQISAGPVLQTNNCGPVLEAQSICTISVELSSSSRDNFDWRQRKRFYGEGRIHACLIMLRGLVLAHLVCFEYQLYPIAVGIADCDTYSDRCHLGHLPVSTGKRYRRPDGADAVAKLSHLWRYRPRNREPGTDGNGVCTFR